MEFNDHSKVIGPYFRAKSAIVTAIASIVLLIFLGLSAHFLGFRTATFAWFANWLCLGWLFVVVRLCGRFQFSDSYHGLRPFERNGQLYRRLGIRGFLRLVRVIRRDKHLVYARLVPEHFELQTRQVEAHHVAVFLWVSVLSGYALVRGYYDAVMWLMLFNVPLNAYPVMLQRYNRGRVFRMLARRRTLKVAVA